MGQSYPKSARLLRRADFQRVYRQGKIQRHRQVVMFTTPSALGDEHSVRFGFTVSKKVSKRAVHRNRLRRVWQEACRLRRGEFRDGIDIVINARRIDPWGLSAEAAQRILLELAGAAGALR